MDNMDNIVERIVQDRQNLLSMNMKPKHLYLGRNQWHELKMSDLYNQSLQTSEDPDQFLGFDLYQIYTDYHYVMTGE